MKIYFTLFVLLFLNGCYEDEFNKKFFYPKSIGNFENLTKESSGILKSKKYEGVYYIHDDSFEKARLYAINLSGHLINIFDIKNSTNIDWEDIGYINNQLFIADSGDNFNYRKNLQIYIFDEPNPYKDKNITIKKTINFHFKEKTIFSPFFDRNYDCEASYSKDNKIYLLTKRRSDNNTTLYVIKKDVAKKISWFNIGGMVTAADYSKDDDLVAVLTYKGIWIFKAEDENIFKHPLYYFPLYAKQCEGITFFKKSVIITNEQGNIYRIFFEDMKKIINTKYEFKE